MPYYFTHLSETRGGAAAPQLVYGLISFAQTYDLSYAWLLAGAGNMYDSPPDDDAGGGKPIPESVAA